MSDQKSTDEANATAIPANIRESLKQFTTHINLTCLECGYIGLMGVTGTIVPWYVSWWTIFFVFVASSYFHITALSLGAILVGVRFLVSKKLVVCPSCKSELKCNHPSF